MMLSKIKALLEITDSSQDALLIAYIELAGDEITSWANLPEVPQKYESTQIQAVINGYSMRGAEGQISHNEGSTARTWKHEDMVSYIRTHVAPGIGVF